jgi:hypothetical protein
VQPILNDEVQTFKALILVHKVLQEGHPIVSGIRWPCQHATIIDLEVPFEGPPRSTGSDGLV